MKRLVLSDENLNSYGFYTITAGIDLGRFQKNPIMLYNHHRTYMGQTNEMLPVGRWENLRIDNGILSGEAVFDEKDPFAVKIKDKVESGFLKGCSIGIRVIETSEDRALLKPGQTRPTVTRCELMEVSIVDIPSNPNASDVVFYDDHMVCLSIDGDIQEMQKLNLQQNMNNIALKLGLPEKATEQECINVIEDLQSLKDELNTLRADNAKMAAELADMKKASVEKILNDAIRTGRIDAKAKKQFENLFESDFDNARSILESLPKRIPLRDTVRETSLEDGIYGQLSWDELDRKGLLPELRERNMELFKLKFKEKFNNDYKN